MKTKVEELREWIVKDNDGFPELEIHYNALLEAALKEGADARAEIAELKDSVLFWQEQNHAVHDRLLTARIDAAIEALEWTRTRAEERGEGTTFFSRTYEDLDDRLEELRSQKAGK